MDKLKVCFKDVPEEFEQEVYEKTNGEYIVVDNEAQIDIVTAISGSGPAFFYKVINEISVTKLNICKPIDSCNLLSIGFLHLIKCSNKVFA